MEVSELAIAGTFRLTPRQFRDDRGVFLEWYRHEALIEAVGHPLDLRQANISVSRQGSLRGLHFADVPPGQAKYVTCVKGAVLDVVVDIRVGSPTFGKYDAVRLDEDNREAVYLSEGLGHGFVALTDDATFVYLCSSVYNPTGEHGINPLDAEIGIDWGLEALGIEAALSEKDALAPSLSEALAAGLLPSYEACLDYAASLSAPPSAPDLERIG
jgi:dTDP-4-dehydrorhamnose 3,5-epimerase